MKSSPFPVAVNLRIILSKVIFEKISPPFEGGVPLTFTVRGGVVDLIISI